MLAKLTETHLRRSFDRATLARAHAYFLEDRVLRTERIAVDVFTAQVRGTAREPYQIQVECFADGGSVGIEADCSCPVGFNCKHAAAALYHYLARQRPGPWQNFSVSAWLHDLKIEAQPPKFDPTRKQLQYRLSLIRDFRTELLVEPQQVQRLAGGTWSKPRGYALKGSSSAQFVQVDDRAIGVLLDTLRFSHENRLRGNVGALLLQMIVKTQRAYWKREATPDPLLSLGETRACRLCFELLADGRQRIAAREEDIDIVLPVSPPWYVDFKHGQCGPLDTGLRRALATEMARAPDMDALDAGQVAATLEKLDPELPAPRKLQIVDRHDLRPTPCATLRMGALRYGAPFSAGQPRDALVELCFDYLGKSVGGPEPAVIDRLHEHTLQRIHRDQEYERSCWLRLEDLGFYLDPSQPGELPCFTTTHPQRVFPDFITRTLPRLEAAGWRITIDSAFAYQIAVPDRWNLTLENESSDWFSLSLDVVVDGRKLALLPLLETALKDPAAKRALDAGEPLLLQLSGGRWVSAPNDRVRKILEIIGELGGVSIARIYRGHAAGIADLSDAGFVDCGDADLRRLARRLRDFSGVETIPPPRGLKADLRPYQRRGLDWLCFLGKYRFGGLLADDMGLGKTLQMLAYLLTELEAGRLTTPALVVAPTSVTGTWLDQAGRFAPDLRCLLLQGPERKGRFADIPRRHLVITSYALLRRDFPVLSAVCWHSVILDESQYIKNPSSDTARKLATVDARNRFCLTGTPLENNLQELWSQFHFLQPGLLGERKRFGKLFRAPIEKRNDAQRRELLVRRIKPFILRRSKDQVATELPKCTEITQWVELQGEQRDLYESIRIATLQTVQDTIAQRGLARSHITILDALLKLRQVCCDPRLLKLDTARGVRSSAKLAQLRDMLVELVAEGRYILLFSQFTQMLSLIELVLQEEAIGYLKLTGRSRNREGLIARFQQGEAPVFLISLKAGGTGLNLTRADTVIHYDPWWNPAVERQATDRAHRIGQEKPVFVYRLMCAGTVEAKINQLQARKQALADALFAPSGQHRGALNATDLEVLFEPLS